MTPLLVALLLGASAQSTGQMSPTSDVSGNRVRATGASTSRALRDHLASPVFVGSATATNFVGTDPAALSSIAGQLAIRALSARASTPATSLVIEDHPGDANSAGDFIMVRTNAPALPRNVLQLSRLGGFKLWDWASVCPYSSVSRCAPANGAMLSIGSDLGASGTTVAISTNNYQGDYLQLNGYSTINWDSGTRKFTFADTNVGGSWDAPGILVFGPKTNSYPAVRNGSAGDAGTLVVRAGDDSGYAQIKASGVESTGWLKGRYLGTYLLEGMSLAGTGTPNAATTDTYVTWAGPGVSSFTVGAPSSAVTGLSLTIDVMNASGGALTVTWNAVFKMETWTSPATGYRRTIRFYYNGTNWVQAGAVSGDVPN